MNVLLVGGAGFIGSHILDALLEKDDVDSVTVVDDLRRGKITNIEHALRSNRARLVRTDASDRWTLSDILWTEAGTEPFDRAFNLACSPLPQSLVQPELVWNNNVKILENLLTMQRAGIIGRLVHFSSSEVYGTVEVGTLSETDPLLPLTPYAASKAACDMMAMSYAKTFDSDVVIVRPFNTIGERQNEGAYAGIVPRTIKRILEGKRPEIYGDGVQTRDLTDVKDVADGAMIVAEWGKKGEVYNLCSGQETRMNELVAMIVNEMSWDGGIDRYPDRPSDVRRHQGDGWKMKHTMGWKPEIKLRETLKRTIEWYKKGMAE